MRIPFDLHPEDQATRQHLITALRASRRERHITFARVGHLLGMTGTAVRGVEDRITWEALTLMRYSRAIGWRIEWRIHGLDIPDDDDVMAVILAAGDQSTPERADRVHWKTVCYDLVRIRRSMLTAVAMGSLLGVGENAVHYWEGNFENSSVIAAQRHARALGGRLDWEIYPCPSPLVSFIPIPRRVL